MTGRQINEMFADQLTSGFENFLRMVSEGKNVFSALGIAAAQTAASILMDLGKMILKQALFNLIAGKSKSGGGGLGGSIATSIATLFPAAVAMNTAGATLGAAGGILTAAATGLGVSAAALEAAATTLMIANSMSVVGAAHGGGIAGSPSMFKSVHPGVFTAAARYHSGGIAGLRPNEIPTILERGEEVLTRNDPRHRRNMRGSMDSGGDDRGIKQVLLLDRKDVVGAMADSEGRKVVLTHISSERAAIRQILGIGP
jgi:hypothetical protein